MTAPAHLGADPGKSGGLAIVYADGTAEAWKMPETEVDLLDLMTELRSRWSSDKVPHATIEVVHAMPKQGVSSSFTFGRGYGALRMALLVKRFALHEVQPAAWQKALGCRTKGDKNVSKRRAQELFPTLKVTHAIADALLIAEYGRRVAGGVG